ncbi:hypothetical protein ARTHROSP310_00360 [Arthrobacter sp. AD-310]
MGAEGIGLPAKFAFVVEVLLEGQADPDRLHGSGRRQFHGRIKFILRVRRTVEKGFVCSKECCGLVLKDAAGIPVVPLRGFGIGGVHIPVAGHPPRAVLCRCLTGYDGIFLDTLCLPHGDPPDVFSHCLDTLALGCVPVFTQSL